MNIDDRNTPEISEVEYDLATLALKGKRFQEAGDMFTALLTKTQTSEAWCGIGLARLGLILEGTTVEEVFFCFEKAKSVGPEKVEDIELVVLQTTMEALTHLYQLYVEAVFASRAAVFKRNLAAVSTAVGGMVTLNSAHKNRVMSSIASASITAFSYDRYLNAKSTGDEMTAFYNKVAKTVEQIKLKVDSFIIEGDKKQELIALVSKNEKWVVETLKTEAQRIAEQKAYHDTTVQNNRSKYIQQKMVELADPGHPFHYAKSEGTRLFTAGKYRKALPVINYALTVYDNDQDLLAMQNKILNRLSAIDMSIGALPFLIIGTTISISFSLDKDGFRNVFIVLTIIGVAILLYLKNQRKANCKAPKPLAPSPIQNTVSNIEE